MNWAPWEANSEMEIIKQEAFQGVPFTSKSVEGGRRSWLGQREKQGHDTVPVEKLKLRALHGCPWFGGRGWASTRGAGKGG